MLPSFESFSSPKITFCFYACLWMSSLGRWFSFSLWFALIPLIVYFYSAVIAILKRFGGIRCIFCTISQGFTGGHWLIDFAIVFHFKSFLHLAPFVFQKLKRVIFVDSVRLRPSIWYNNLFWKTKTFHIVFLFWPFLLWKGLNRLAVIHVPLKAI